MKLLRILGTTALVVVLWNCGADGLGTALTDAGSLLRDSGTAHAQTNCTWTVRRFGLAGTTSWLSEITLPQGWEPFAVHDSAVLARSCM